MSIAVWRMLNLLDGRVVQQPTNFLLEVTAVSVELGAVTRASSQPVTPFSKAGAALGTSSATISRSEQHASQLSNLKWCAQLSFTRNLPIGTIASAKAFCSSIAVAAGLGSFRPCQAKEVLVGKENMRPMTHCYSKECYQQIWFSYWWFLNDRFRFRLGFWLCLWLWSWRR